MNRSVTRCALLLTAAASGLLLSAPAAQADATLRVSETSGLAAGHTVTVNLDGLPANLATVAVGQCKPQIVQPTDCNLTGSLMGRADEQGVWQPNGGNRTLTLVAAINGTDCATSAGACTVSVTSLTDPSHILASVPLTFGAKQTPPTSSPAAAASSDSDDDNTGVAVGVGAAVVAVAAAVGVVLFRRRGAGTR
ncbi:neocarzinostatin apoprotein domain-containing protein [Nocardia yamanashiensis]|uniref:neocarzinostatin apoprotein domain-containing protein n=1 Tax=Nocardia yamanashiensis TaxID=209247 RepID=UPI000832A351|nr:neocarzinostatin apoprotein domain-containing protein [Nocardia yamanashiensis]